jgi:hypothetical protein
MYHITVADCFVKTLNSLRVFWKNWNQTFFDSENSQKIGTQGFFIKKFQFFIFKFFLEPEVINKSNNQANTVLDMVMDSTLFDLLNGHLHMIHEHLYTSTLGSTNW